MRYVSVQDPEIAAHIGRHFSGSATPGSKFLPMSLEARQGLLERVDAEVRRRFEDAVARGETPGRVLFELDLGRPVGTDALVALDTLPDDAATATVVRDRGSDHETPVKVAVTAPSAMPRTSSITVVAGPDREGQSFGLWTMFPGAPAPAFPNPARQTPEQVAESQAFWDAHAFRATPNEILATDPQGPGTATALHAWYGTEWADVGQFRLDADGAVRYEIARSDGLPATLGCSTRPAVIRADGTEEWYWRNERHRTGDQPALIRPTEDGGRIEMHYVHGRLERNPRLGPAIAEFDAAGNEREAKRVYAVDGEKFGLPDDPAMRAAVSARYPHPEPGTALAAGPGCPRR